MALIDATTDVCLVDHQDGGEKIDVVYSKVPGSHDDAMTLPEAEGRLDVAIRQLYGVLTGQRVEGDPMEFINS